MHEIAFGRHEQRKEVPPPPPRGVDCRAVVVLKAPLLHLKTDTGKGGRRRRGTVECCHVSGAVITDCTYTTYLVLTLTPTGFMRERDWMELVESPMGLLASSWRPTATTTIDRLLDMTEMIDPHPKQRYGRCCCGGFLRLSLSLSSVAVFWLRSMCGFDFFICNKSAESISNSNRQSTECLQLLQRE